MTKQYNDYYTYAFLREDKTPYYIGKGRGKRIHKGGRTIKPPKDKSRILLLKKGLTEAEAFKHEVYMIFVLGRKDLGTGILRNRTNGGEGTSGHVKSEKCKKKMSVKHSGEKHPQYGNTGALSTTGKANIAIKPDGTQRHFGSGCEAARELGIDQSHLSKYARSGHVLTQGKWKGWQFLYAWYIVAR